MALSPNVEARANQLANLIPGSQPEMNPGSKPQKLAFRSILADKLQEKYQGERTRLEDVADSLIRFAASGNVPAVKELLDRFEGPVVQKIEVAVNPEKVLALSSLIAEFVPTEKQAACIERVVAILSQV